MKIKFFHLLVSCLSRSNRTHSQFGFGILISHELTAMYYQKLVLCLYTLLVYLHSDTAAEHVRREYHKVLNNAGQLELRALDPRAGGNPYLYVLNFVMQAHQVCTTADPPHSNIVNSLFRSKGGSLVRHIADIPCSVIQNLGSDANEAEQFVSQIEAGQVPSAITNLPDDVVSEFSNILNIVTGLPDAVVNVAEAAVTDVVSIVNDIEDGSITALVDGIPSEVIGAITNGWDDLTSAVGSVAGDVTNFVKCDILGDCPASTSSASDGAGDQSCAAPAAASASTTPAGAAPSVTPQPAASTTPAGAAPTVTPQPAASTSAAAMSSSQASYTSSSYTSSSAAASSTQSVSNTPAAPSTLSTQPTPTSQSAPSSGSTPGSEASVASKRLKGTIVDGSILTLLIVFGIFVVWL